MKRLDGSRLEGTAEKVRRSHHEAIEELQGKQTREAYGFVEGITGGLAWGKNVKRVQRLSTGLYEITLAIPFEVTARFIQLTSFGNGGAIGAELMLAPHTPTQFRVLTHYSPTTGPTVIDGDFMFRVS